MSEELELRPQDRILVVAPHPDDESIGAGGLLQVARAAGAAIRVVLLTDGDNNPWPQRWLEKRWRIGPAERARWGARRRAEAHGALNRLGIPESDVRFLGLPDLGLTDLLMRADAALPALFASLLDEFQPTLLVFPALSDRHPDHNAADIVVRFALARYAGKAPRLLTFTVHGAGAAAGSVSVALDAQRHAAKKAAILAHESQMQFSRGRFVAFAGDHERFQPVSFASDPTHPLQARIDGPRLSVHLDLKRWGRRRRDEILYVALEGTSSVRMRIALALGEHGAVYDYVGGGVIAPASVKRGTESLDIWVGLPNLGDWRQGYIKLARREPGWRVFDRFGWQFVAS